MHVCVVGASLAGLRTVQVLRAEGFAGRITLVGEEDHLPYDRTTLSKSMLLRPEMEAPRLLAGDADLVDLEVQRLFGVAAVGLRRADRLEVSLSSGTQLRCDRLVLACGAAANQPFHTSQAGVHTLRTANDALAVRAAMARAKDLVIVGGGFIGLEVASAARHRGLNVTVVESAGQPLARALGPVIGEVCGQLHARHGVRLRCGVGVAGFTGRGHVDGVRLRDGTTLKTDTVVVGVGARPAVGWLAGCGLPIVDGVLADEAGAVDERRTVYAVGDVACWRTPQLGVHRRVEHWSHAAEQARIVALDLLRPGSAPPIGVPYVWSDQYDKKLQIVGWPETADELWSTDLTAGPDRFAALYFRQGNVVGAFAVDNPALIGRARRLIAAGTPVAEAVAALSGSLGQGRAFTKLRVDGARNPSEPARVDPQVTRSVAVGT